MRKRHLVLVLGLLAVMLISNLEDYLSSPEFSVSEPDYEAIDYYLNDFSLQAIAADGRVSHTLDGQYLAHSQDKKISRIVQPRIASRDDNAATDQPVDAVSLTAEEATLDHTSNIAELNGQVRLLITGADTTQFRLDTSQLNYDISQQHISTQQAVAITSPQLTMSADGLEGELAQSILRLNANVKSTYQPE